jgi:hypothetical protein
VVPSRGICETVFLLTEAGSTSRLESLEAWVNATHRLVAGVGNQGDRIANGAAFMTQSDLARIRDGLVVVDGRLVQCGNRMEHFTLVRVARIVLEAEPPRWLGPATAGNKFDPECVPDSDLEKLQWLGELLEPLLLQLNSRDPDNERFKTWLGETGELIALQLERSKQGRTAERVSQLSDMLGYDIQSTSTTNDVTRIEVKTSIKHRHNRFFISRNEVNKAERFGDEWTITQVILTSNAVVADVITRDHVDTIRTMSAAELLELTPNDTEYGKWTESAQITTNESVWNEIEFELPPEWTAPGIE